MASPNTSRYSFTNVVLGWVTHPKPIPSMDWSEQKLTSSKWASNDKLVFTLFTYNQALLRNLVLHQRKINSMYLIKTVCQKAGKIRESGFDDIINQNRVVEKSNHAVLQTNWQTFK